MRLKISLTKWCSLLFTLLWAFMSYASENQTMRKTFEERYQAWKAWVTSHRYLSDYTSNQEFQAIVDLGVPALPYIVEKIEKNPDDFHLVHVIDRTAKKHFEKSEWPQGTLGDSIIASKMYLRWWKEGRFKTGERFAELHGKWKALKAENKDQEAEETYQRIVWLGIPVLPYLIEKVEQDPELVPAIAKLAGKELKPTATSAECKIWWAKNRQKYTLPPAPPQEKMPQP